MEKAKRYAVFMDVPGKKRAAKRMTDWLSELAAQEKAETLSRKIPLRDFLLRAYRAKGAPDKLYRNGRYLCEQSRDEGNNRLIDRLRFVNEVALWALLLIALPAHAQSVFECPQGNDGPCFEVPAAKFAPPAVIIPPSLAAAAAQRLRAQTVLDTQALIDNAGFAAAAQAPVVNVPQGGFPIYCAACDSPSPAQMFAPQVARWNTEASIRRLYKQYGR